MTFDDTKGSDFVACEVWAKRGAQSKLVYALKQRLSFPQTIDAMERVTRLFPTSRRKFVEKKANGAAALASLRKKIPGLIPVTPRESKPERGEAVSPFVRAGNFEIPTTEVATIHPTIAFDPEEFIDEATAFPRGTHDDLVDAFTQYAKETYLVGGTGKFLSPTNPTRPTNIPKQEGETISPMQRRLAKSRKESS